jgi:hypothetical protein
LIPLSPELCLLSAQAGRNLNADFDALRLFGQSLAAQRVIVHHIIFTLRLITLAGELFTFSFLFSREKFHKGHPIGVMTFDVSFCSWCKCWSNPDEFWIWGKLKFHSRQRSQNERQL